MSMQESQLKEPNGIGVAGFVLAILSLILPIPWIDVFIGILAIVFSSIGMDSKRKNRGLAIAGLIIAIMAVIGGIMFWTNAEILINGLVL